MSDQAVRDRRIPSRYVFADCVLDTELYALYRAGLAIPLRPKAFQVLLYLLEHRDHLLTKDDLCARVWPAQFISDATIETCIKQVRQAIGDTGRAQALIQTRRGYGYRFVGVVEEQSETPGAEEATATMSMLPTAVEPEDAHRESMSSALSGRELEASSIPKGERKLVTLLGCTPTHTVVRDARIELDALHRQMRTLYALARQEVERYGGTIHSIAGTRLLAIFGAPHTQEDHARRALLAAWALRQQLAARGGDSTEEPLAACLALHTGVVVVGGIEEAEKTAVIGDVTLAIESLQERGESGVLLCSGATARLIRHDAQIEEVSRATAIGQPNPVPAYRILGLRAEGGSGAQVGPRLSPFVGRAHELAALHAVLAQVVGGRGQSLGIVGEPGIGKSRLVAEFRQQLQAHGNVMYLEGHCLSHGSATSYLPVVHLIRAHCGITAADGDDVITRKVSAGIDALGLARERVVPYLLHLLGLNVAAEVADSSPDLLKERTFAALRQLWFKTSQKTPLILAVEDLHWSDPTSQEFLASLVDGLPGVTLLLLATYRPGYRPPWVEKSYVTQLTVPPLSVKDSIEVARALLDRETPRPLLEALLTRAQGNPFFLEELAQALVEHDATSEGGSTNRSADFRLPPTVEAVLAARIDRLSARAKQLLQTASVIGMDAPVPLLQLLAKLPAAVLHKGLAQLQGAEFVYESHRSPEPTYTFKHALTQEVAYDSLLLERQQMLHGQIVEALETLTTERDAEAASGVKGHWRESDQLERLAHHALRGHVWAKALEYCRHAGEKAMARSAHREACSYFEQALLALGHVPESDATPGQAIDLRLALRSALHPCGELERALACVREAEALAVALDDRRRLGQVSAAVSLHCYLMGQYDAAVSAAERALALAAAASESDASLLATLQLGFAHQALGEYRQAIECLSRTVVPSDGAQEHARFGELVPAVFTPAYLAACHAELGAFGEGRTVGDAGLRIADAVEDPMSLAFASWGVGLLALRQGELSRAVSVLERAVKPCQGGDPPAWFPLVAAALGAAYTLAGRVNDARFLLTRALERTIATKVVVNQALCSVALGEAELLAGCLDEAQGLAEGALSLASAHRERGNAAYARYLLGEIAMRRQPVACASAKAHYREALALADTLGMQPLQAHCRHALGLLHARMGRRTQAYRELSSAIEKYRAMGMTLWLPRAEAALARVSRDGRPGLDRSSPA